MKPRIVTACVANRYATKNERIVEFSHNGKGGLISIAENAIGELVVNVYRCDPGIVVFSEVKEQHHAS